MRTQKRRWPMLAVVLSMTITGCGGEEASSVPVDPTQVPPTTSDKLDSWVATEPWKTWKCEPQPRGPHLNSPHDLVRVCENALLVNAPATGNLPVGAAAVKEMYDQGKVYAYTIAVRGKPGPGSDKWFWWRKVIDGSANPPITHQTFGDGFCSGCHDLAKNMGGRDSIFTFLR